ncbi:peptidylprolyl isomerase [Sphingomonas sp. JC676]|uniref:peptidylprolyl isomerase n=1 Tax=Sphingomonas sp. JC676 TaxID=2768065 RepID=UPI001657CD3C|nr:peptidylprolyl isomerase [Sphingomonas sp. JC676]MBC9031500.1 peptidylprolyl isomerase [Sphingomonas sp. JC676]
MSVAKTVRAGRKMVLALGVAGLATIAGAQTVPDQSVPSTGLDLPSNLQIFGKADPNIRKPTAIVNDVVITGTDVDQRVAMIVGLQKLNMTNLKPEERDQLRLAMLRQLIDETLQIQEAKANEITVEPKEIEQGFNRVSKNFSRTPEEMRTWLKANGSSERSVKRQIEAEMAWSRLLRRRVNINVGEAEVQAMIDRMKAAKGSDEFHVYEIYQNATSDRSQEVFAGMQKMIQQMRDGAPFDYLARTYSESSTKAQGGDLGWVRPAMLPDALAKAAQEMSPGQVAGPIELPTGFSILYLAEKRQVLMPNPLDATLSLRQLTINFAPGTTEAQATARAGAFATATQAIKGCGDVAKVAGAENAEVVDKDGIVLRDLPPALQNIVMPLQIGQVTQPFGTIQDGVRVLVICGRDEPKMANMPTAEQLQEQIEDQRVNLRAQRMLRDLRRDALVEYR